MTLNLELLNSKVDHKGYQADHTAWGLAVLRRLRSSRLKLLYDIYHMQIMEGDVIRTIQTNIDQIGHFHTGGVPGRAELDDSQELNYRAVCRAIAATGYSGYISPRIPPPRRPAGGPAPGVRDLPGGRGGVSGLCGTALGPLGLSPRVRSCPPPFLATPLRAGRKALAIGRRGR